MGEFLYDSILQDLIVGGDHYRSDYGDEAVYKCKDYEPKSILKVGDVFTNKNDKNICKILQVEVVKGIEFVLFENCSNKEIKFMTFEDFNKNYDAFKASSILK